MFIKPWVSTQSLAINSRSLASISLNGIEWHRTRNTSGPHNLLREVCLGKPIFELRICVCMHACDEFQWKKIYFLPWAVLKKVRKIQLLRTSGRYWFNSRLGILFFTRHFWILFFVLLLLLFYCYCYYCSNTQNFRDIIKRASIEHEWIGTRI